MSYSKILITLFIFTLFSCGSNDDNVTPVSEKDWNIPVNEVFDGGPGKDGIPALLNPEMISASEAIYLTEQSLVVGYKEGDEVRAYPHEILNWHEIINDDFNGHPIAITYCPLTGTGIGWEREYNGSTTTFGVSGLLYNTNLIPYDRNTDSYWSQMKLECVGGELINQKANTFNVVETNWETWRTMYPETKVVSTNTNHSRNYLIYPYGSYRNNNDLLFFPVSNVDNRIAQKERVLGVIINDKVKVYRFSDFVDLQNNSSTDQTVLIKDTFEGKSLILAGNIEKNFIVAFEENSGIELTAITDNSEAIMIDQKGNKWNLFGQAIEGDRTGEKLIPAESYIGFWFSFAAFFPTPQIYTD